MKMMLSYAKEFLTKGRAGHWRTISCWNDLLVIEDLETYQSSGYLGTRLSNGELQADEKGYVTFTTVKPVIDENTRFTLY
jgi:hypothetical protein